MIFMPCFRTFPDWNGEHLAKPPRVRPKGCLGGSSNSFERAILHVSCKSNYLRLKLASKHLKFRTLHEYQCLPYNSSLRYEAHLLMEICVYSLEVLNWIQTWCSCISHGRTNC